MEEKQQQGHKLRDIVSILFKHKYKTLIAFAVLIIATFVSTFFLTTYYASRSVLMIKLGREFSSTPEVGEVRTPINQEAIVNAEIQILTSRDLIGKVVQEIGPTNIYPKLVKQNMSGAILQELAIVEFLQNVFARPVKGSSIIEVYFRHENPYVAAKALGLLIDYFKEKHLQVFSERKTSFLEEQLKSYEEQLKESEAKIEAFKQKHNVVALEEQKSVLIKQRSDAELLLMSEQAGVSELQKRYEYLKNRKELVTESVSNDLRIKLNEAERKEQDILQRYNENSRYAQEVRKQIKMIKDQLQKQEDEFRSLELSSIEGQLKPLESRVATRKKQIEQLDKDIQLLDSRTREFMDLRREAATNEVNYQTYLKKFEESRISDDMDLRKMTNIVIVQQASVPVTPMPSQRNKIIGGGIFVSIAFAMGLAFVSEYIPQCLTNPTGAEKRLRLPVLSVISYKK